MAINKVEGVEDKYFQVVTAKNDGIPEILLYGYIGQSFWWDDENEESITDLEFKKTLSELSVNNARVNVRINSGGGSMIHGNAIITAIQSSKIDIHVYNDGLAGSMGAGIWLSLPAEKRHMATNALLMVHPPSSCICGTAVQMREEAEVMDKFEQTIILMMQETTDFSAEEIKEKYFDGKNHWLTSADCKEAGFVKEVDNYVGVDLIENVTNLSHADIAKHYQKEYSKSNQKPQVVNAVVLNNISNQKIKSKMSLITTAKNFLKSFGKDIPVDATEEQIEQIMNELTSSQIEENIIKKVRLEIAAETANAVAATNAAATKTAAEIEAAKKVATDATVAAAAAVNQSSDLAVLLKDQSTAMEKMMKTFQENNAELAKSVANHIAKNDSQPLVNVPPADKVALNAALEDGADYVADKEVEGVWKN